MRHQKFILLRAHLQQQKVWLGDGLAFEGDPAGHPQMEIRFHDMLIWLDFRAVQREPREEDPGCEPAFCFWGIGFEDFQTHQQKAAAFEFWFNDGYQECFAEDQACFSFLDRLLKRISEGEKPPFSF